MATAAHDPGHPLSAATAFVVSGIASLIGVLSPVWAQATAEPVSTWVPAGSAGVAVTALAYGARKMAKGELVPLNIAEVVAASHRIADQAVLTAEASARREDAFRDALVANTQALTAMTTTLGTIAEQISRPPVRRRAPTKAK